MQWTYVSDQILRFRSHRPLGRGGRPQLLHLVVHGQHADEIWIQQQALDHGHVWIRLAVDVDPILFQLQVYPLERGYQFTVPCKTTAAVMKTSNDLCAVCGDATDEKLKSIMIMLL